MGFGVYRRSYQVLSMVPRNIKNRENRTKDNGRRKNEPLVTEKWSDFGMKTEFNERGRREECNTRKCFAKWQVRVRRIV